MILYNSAHFYNWKNALNQENEEYPTMYSRCDINNKCGGNLVCDAGRCRQKLGGNCAANLDCESGLVCNNWICTNPEVKTVRFKDKDEVHYI